MDASCGGTSPCTVIMNRYRQIGAVFDDGDDQFWLVDAAISYRFPKRYGFVTLGVKNLFDEEFDYFEVDKNNLNIQQDTQVFFKLTLALP